jgi:hypothetical protein
MSTLDVLPFSLVVFEGEGGIVDSSRERLLLTQRPAYQLSYLPRSLERFQ